MRNEWCDLGAKMLFRRILEKAEASGASDIHIEPGPDETRLRFRIDGILEEEGRLARAMAPSLSVRVKVLAHMDVGESRLPQDGSFYIRRGGKWTDFRVSVLPSLYGETIVIRLLGGSQPVQRDHLGMAPEQEKLFLEKLSLKSGLILTTGPTGSGKTSTLYAALEYLNRPGVSIVSVEDPVEYRVAGVTQVGINEKAGLTFAAGLRSILRQDPDIILIGEIRDKETASIAIHASLTGHLVLSSLHADRAYLAPLRLQDMGIAPSLAAAGTSLIISQRLIPKICPSCHGTGTVENKPCSLCGGRGRKGRAPIFECLPMTETVRDLVRSGNTRGIAKEMIRSGQMTLEESMERLADQGIIARETGRLYVAGGRS